jgi:poly(A) polymerase
VPPDQVAPKPLITGVDLIAMGLKESPLLGRIASALYDAQLNEEFASPDQARQAARKLIAENE